MTKRIAESGIAGWESFKVHVEGVSGVMFNRFIDMTSEHTPDEKMHLELVDGKKLLCWPSENVMSFLGARSGGKSCAAKFMGKKAGPYYDAVLASVVIEPEYIPITKEGKRVEFHGWRDEEDKASGLKIAHHKAIVVKNKALIPVPQARPVLALPWEMDFSVSWFSANEAKITRALLEDWFMRGGLAVGFGSYRPRFGRFLVTFD